MSGMVVPGNRLDLAFVVKIVRRGEIEEVRFAELLTRRTVVSVYMRNNTPGCDRQNERLTAVAAELNRAGCNLVAVSRDTAGSHRRYAAARKISHILVSDPTDQFASATGSLVQKSMYGRTFAGPARAAYLLERDGTVLGVVAKVVPAEHAAQLSELISNFRK